MNDYNEGDLVEAVMGETVIRGRLSSAGKYLWVGDSGRTPENIESYGFTVSIIEKAPPKVVLPTEPGFYITAYNDPDVFELYLSGDWFLGDVAISEARVICDGGNQLTRLEPVPETAKKVLDRLDVWEIHEGADSREVFAKVAKEFGVEL